MKFSVKARVLLELGSDLISSDAIALYELIKNSIDAGSEKIEVRFVCQLTQSGYQAFDEDIERLLTSRVTHSFLEENVSRYFDDSVNLEIVTDLVEKLSGLSIESARQKLREFYVSNSYIEIEDWGHGMSRADIEEKFLTIGTPHRAEQRKALENANTPILGEKGIGRLSAMRLGHILEMRSARDSDPRWAQLLMDWSGLRDEPGKELDEFDVQVTNGKPKEKAVEHGTLIRV